MKEVHPLIISASRRTDVPAFFMDWFLDVWKRGWTDWINPFNPRQKKLVRFDKTELVVFWSKFPVGILKRLEELDFDFLLLYTLNDYPILEPRLPRIEERVELFKELSSVLGPERVIWRFDPLVFTDRLDADELLRRFERLAERLSGYTKRVITSVMTPYGKAVARLKRAGVLPREPSIDEIRQIGKGMYEVAKSHGMEIQTCAERYWMIFEEVGVKKGACIDPVYISEVFRENKTLIEGLSKLKKDRGQRRLCGCVESVDIGRYNTCRFGCLYCYAV